MKPRGELSMSENYYSFPTSFAQQRLWFLHQLTPKSPTYNVPAAMRLKGALDVKALEQSLIEVVRRHEILRTTFVVIDGEPVQLVAPVPTIPLRLEDLCRLPEPEHTSELKRLINEESLQPFNLVRGPLLRATLLRLRDDEHVLLLVMHHIVCDGWSIGLLLRALSSLYVAY